MTVNDIITQKITKKKGNYNPYKPVNVQRKPFDIKDIIVPVKPFRSMKPFNLFLKTAYKERQDVRESNMFENMTKLRREWKEMTDEQRKKYEDGCLADRERYAKEWTEYKKTGFYTNQHGVHSIDLAIAKRSFKPHIILPKKLKRPKEVYIAKHHQAKKESMAADSKPAAILNALATDWTALSAEEKLPYREGVKGD